MSVALSSHNKPLTWQIGSGCSDTFRSLRSAITAVIRHKDHSIVLGWRRELRDRLAEVVTEASDPNWDGYDALPLSDLSICTARYIIGLLPETTPLPDIVPSINGEIAFEWDRGPSHIFSIKTHRGLLVYAGLLGRDRKYHGQEPLGDELSKSITTVLATFFSKA